MIHLSLLKRQQGFSLVELMVAVVVGLFIIIGISSVYVGSKRSSITTTELSLLQANGRAVLEQLTAVIQHTGYKSTRSSLDSDMFILGPVTNSQCSDGVDSVANTTLFSAIENDTARGDTIGIVYLGDDLLTMDCTGSEIPTNCRLSDTSPALTPASKIYNYFKADVNADGMPVLTCAGSLRAEEDEIAEGVENLQINYGEDVDSDGMADRFVNSDDVSNWNSIVSVNVAVLVRSLRPIAVSASVRSYQLLDNVVVTPNDKYLRAVFTTTIRLRNATS
ncbi:MAG: PilW family protein [Leucothrix sp.]